MNVLIIEDEIMSAEDLAEMIVKVDPAIQVMALISSVKEGLAYFKEETPINLIFADIQLGDGLSFEIFNAIECRVPIIFCTAFDQYAIEAFKQNGIDYVLKPFDLVAIANALSKYQQFKKYFTPIQIDYEALIQKIDALSIPSYSSVLVYQRDKVMPIRFDEIALFHIENEISYVICFNKKTYSVSQTLEELERMGKGYFYRANRQYLVNRVAIKDVSAYFNRKYVINLNIEFDEKIIIGKNKATDFMAWLTRN